MIGRGLAAFVLGALAVTTLAVVPAQASETASPSWTVDPSALTALSQATELATFASIQAGALRVADAAITLPDPRTLYQDAQSLASYVNALPDSVRAKSFANGPADIDAMVSGLGDLLNVGTVPDVSGFLDSATRVLIGVQVVYTVPDLVGGVDVRALADSAVSLTTYLTGQAGQLVAEAQAIISNLPTVDELNDLVRAEVAYFAAEVHDGYLVQADALLLWLGQQIVGPLDIVGPTLEQALDAAGSLANTLSDLADGLDPRPTVGIEPAPIPKSLALAVVDTGPGHDFLPDIVDPALANVSGANVGPTLDGIQDSAATATGYRCYTRNHDACAPPLTWHGGKVQHKPRVNVIFWGPKWSNHQDLQNAVTGMFGSLPGSGFQSVLTQYYDTAGSVSANMTYAAWVDTSTPPATLYSTLLVNEAMKAAKAKGWGTSDDVTWMIYPQEGVASVSKTGSLVHCGFHNNGTDNTGRRWVFGVVDYPAATVAHDYSGCARSVGSVQADLTAGGSHEYAEAVTDPFFDGWFDGKGQENADLCAGLAPVGGIVPLWSNDGRAGYCTLSFTPRYTYKITSAVAPAGEALKVYARGHDYLGGQVIATNTGNMPWFPGGSSPTRLGTWGPADRCSHAADMNTKDTSNSWLSCRRIRMTGTEPVEPAGVSPGTSSATFDVRLKPDGALVDDHDYPEAFNLVSSVWMGPSSGSSPTLRYNTAKFDAAHAMPTTGDPIVAGVAGMDLPVAVQLDYTVKGTAPWYGNEVVYLGTSGPGGNGHASVWAASTWPRSGACTKCRAARVTTTTQPSQTFTFKFTLHIPSTMPTGTYQEFFRPVADVAINGGGVGAKYFGTVVPVTIAVVGVPVGTHEITATGTVGSEPTEGYDTSDVTTPTPYGHWFACTAVATADAVSTRIDSCSIDVTHADGITYAVSAGGTSSSGGVAVVDGWGVTYDEAGGDTARVCWKASATYADRTTKATSACTT